MYLITSQKLNLIATNDSINDPEYFNKLFKTDDCAVILANDPTPDEIQAEIIIEETSKISAIEQEELNKIALKGLIADYIAKTPELAQRQAQI